MCNAYTLRADLNAIARATRDQLGLPLVNLTNAAVPERVFPRRDGLILRPRDAARPASGLEPVVAHWNLTPAFHRGPLKAWKASTNNARSETMATSPAFRAAVKARRCLIPATSFTEWTGPTGGKTAHAISRADGGLLFLAGLWERAHPPDGPADTYTMVMIDADGDDDVAPFHNRQPVVLDADRAATWLDLTADDAPVLTAPPPGTLVADPPEPAG